jgi:hypothetical protein
MHIHVTDKLYPLNPSRISDHMLDKLYIQNISVCPLAEKRAATRQPLRY